VSISQAKALWPPALPVVRNEHQPPMTATATTTRAPACRRPRCTSHRLYRWPTAHPRIGIGYTDHPIAGSRLASGNAPATTACANKLTSCTVREYTTSPRTTRSIYPGGGQDIEAGFEADDAA
jgi:hypothetical protein